MSETKLHKFLPCDETPDNCNFLLKKYQQGETFNNMHKEMNYLVFCKEGEVHLTSSLFREEVLYGGEIMFLPRMADCQGEVWKETQVVVHTFSNTVCRPENCILRYLYTHAKKKMKANQVSIAVSYPHIRLSLPLWKAYLIIWLTIQVTCYYGILNTKS